MSEHSKNFASSSLDKSIRFFLWSIIISSVLIRGFLAWYVELGNDEVYYWTYALYPDWSHFDHPPMVGFFIWLTTLNLHFDSELFLRLSSVILGGVNICLVYRIGCKLKNCLTGLYAAIFFTGSVYCFVITGIFIMPDTPQLFFWLLSLMILIHVLPDRQLTARSRQLLLLLGLTIGLAMLSKYTSAYLWVAIGIFILFYNPKWLKTTELYVAILISAVMFLPVIYWNYKYNFISFTFHGERVNLFTSGVRPDLFFTELAGQILYNNPINFVVIIIALIALFRKKFSLNTDYKKILLLTSLPLAGLFLLFALFRPTLPHWSGPGYVSLILLSAIFLAEKNKEKKLTIPVPAGLSVILLVVGLGIALAEIKTGFIGQPATDDPTKLGKNDVTLDLSGWRNFGSQFRQLRLEDIESGEMSVASPIVVTRWFPAAHIDYYVAKPSGQNVIGIGELKNLHKYAWINRLRPELYPTSNAYYITSSRAYKAPDPSLLTYFDEISEPVIIKGFKGEKHVQNFFVYRLKYCKSLPPDILESMGFERDLENKFD